MKMTTKCNHLSWILRVFYIHLWLGVWVQAATGPQFVSMAQLEAEMHRLSGHMNEMVAKMNRLEREMTDEIRSRRTSENSFRQRLTQLETGSQQSGAGGPVIAFTASLSRRLTNLKNRQTIIFDFVHTNLGGGYNAQTGQFRCPVNGLYYFTVTIMSDSNDRVETELVVNGLKETVQYAGGNRYGGSGSNAILLKLSAGDLVWIRLFHQFGLTVERDRSTFSGHLVRQI